MDAGRPPAPLLANGWLSKFDNAIADCLNLRLQGTPDLHLDINRETVHDIIESMDTAWDKKVMKAVLDGYTFYNIENTSHTL